MCTFMVALVEKFISESSLNYIGPSLITPEQESLDKSELPPFLQFSSVTQSCPTLYNPMNHSTPGLPVHHQLPESTNPCKPMSIELVMPFNHLILCHPLILLPSIFPGIRVFSNESVPLIRWPKYRSFSFNISLPMNTQD